MTFPGGFDPDHIPSAQQAQDDHLVGRFGPDLAILGRNACPSPNQPRLGRFFGACIQDGRVLGAYENADAHSSD
jgi:hypothetical protein